MNLFDPQSAAKAVALVAAGGILPKGQDSALLRTILDALPMAVYATDAEGVVTYFNPAAAALAGREPQIGVDRWCVTWRLYTMDGAPLPHDQCPMAMTLREKRPVHGVEAIAERPDGTRVTFAPYPTPLFSPDGDLIGGVNVLVDISDRKSGEIALRRADHARQQLVSIVESSDDAIVSKDLNGIVVSWNAAAERLFGYTAQEMIGQPITILIPENRLDEEMTILGRIRRGERLDHFETVRRRKDGTPVDVSLTVSPVRDADGRVVGASKIARDISARKRTEAALARHMDEQAALFRLTDALNRANTVEQIYESALDAIQHALRCDRASILLKDEHGVMRFVAWRGLSDAYRKAVDGHSPWAESDTNPRVVCLHDVARADLTPALKATVLDEGIGACAFIPLMANDQLIGKFMAYYRDPHEFDDAAVEVGLAVARQLAFGLRKKQAEENLRTNEERLRLATSAGKVGVWEWDIPKNRVTWTDSIYAMHGVSKDAFSGTVDGFNHLIHPDDRERVANSIRKSLSDANEPYELEFRAVKPDGEIVWLMANAAVIRENGKPVRLLGSTLDITERKASDAQRDLLVAELSHRVKNTLATVISIAHQSFSRGPSVEDARRSFDGRIRALAQTHGRLAEGNWSGVSFETMLHDEFAPYRREDGKNVTIAGPKITLNPRHAVVLGMAFHELATNAAKYGALSTKTGAVDVAWQIAGPNELRIRWRESGGPAVATPKRSGFGRLLLERALASDLQGKVALNFAETGLTCEITVPLDGRPATLH